MKPKIKQFRSLIALALCAFIGTNFSSCSKEHEDEPDLPSVQKRMKSIAEGNSKKSFIYTDGKNTQETKTYGRPPFEESYSTDIIYSESSIIIDSDVYELEDGLITKYTHPYGFHTDFTYENGRIKTIKGYDEKGKLDKDILFEWKDDVIVHQTEYNNGNTGVIDLLCEYEYEYTEYRDYGGAVAFFQSDSILYDDLPECLIIQGYFGKWPKYLVSKAVDRSGYFKGTNTYTYSLDKDGYPVGIGGSERANFTWEKK